MKKAFPYEVTQVAPGVHLVNEQLSTMFVVQGENRAAVIDCGTGVGDFKATVESITSLPYDLIATHAHVDHVGGRGQFDKLFISAADAGKIKASNVAYRIIYILSTKIIGNKVPLSCMSVKRVKKEPEVSIIKEGDVFDLGGRTLTVIETPGHTKGSVCLLDSQEKILFAGDVSNPVLVMWLDNCTTIKGAVPALEKLLGLEGYDKMWSAHTVVAYDRNDVRKCLEAIKKLAEKKNSLLPVIRKFAYNGINIMYRASHIG